MTILELTLKSIWKLAQLPRWRGRLHPELTDDPAPDIDDQAQKLEREREV
jgi:hypothetical protein